MSKNVNNFSRHQVKKIQKENPLHFRVCFLVGTCLSSIFTVQSKISFCTCFSCLFFPVKLTLLPHTHAQYYLYSLSKD